MTDQLDRAINSTLVEMVARTPELGPVPSEPLDARRRSRRTVALIAASVLVITAFTGVTAALLREDPVVDPPVATAVATTGVPNETAAPTTAPASATRDILVAGDLMAAALARPLDDIGYRVTGVTSRSSGLSRPDFVDWSSELDAALAELPAGAPVVFAAGSNDYQALTDTEGLTVAPVGVASWAVEYRQRVIHMMDKVVGAGHPLVWIGIAQTTDPDVNGLVASIRHIVADAAHVVPGVTVIDAWSLFDGPDGGYADTIDVQGVPTKIFEAGPLLTDAGASLLAQAVDDALQPGDVLLDEFTEGLACVNLVVVASTADGTHALLFGFQSDPYIGPEYSQTYQLPDPRVEVTMMIGQSITEPLCNDLYGPDYRLDETIVLDRGTITLQVSNGVATVGHSGLGSTDRHLLVPTGELTAVVGPGGG